MSEKTQKAKQSIEEALRDPEPMKPRRGWVGFVEGEAVNFMNQFDIEKMTLDDGAGNKAKLSRLKDNAVKVECASTNIV